MMTPGREWVWSLRWIYEPLGKEKAFVVMGECNSRAVFDESGTHSKSGWCVVAGFLGTVKQWTRFAGIWGPYANRPGFHAKSFFVRDPQGERVKPYDGWSNRD